MAKKAKSSKTKSTKKTTSSKHSKKSSKRGCSFITLLIALALICGGIYMASKHKGRGETGLEEENTKPKNKYKVLGIDISHHNGTIKWSQVKNEGIKFVYIKSTQGTSHLNRRFKKNYDNAKEQGLTTGFYHFFMFERDGEKQARFFLAHSVSEGMDLPPALDVEYSPPDTRRKTGKTIIQNRIKEIRRFDKVIYNELGIHPVIYTNKECYKDLIKGNFKDNEIWICDLNKDDKPDIDEKWIIWQYSHKGKVKGIDLKVDMDVFNGTENDFKKWIESYQ